MVLVLELVLIAGLAPGLCCCDHTQFANSVLAPTPLSGRRADQDARSVPALESFRTVGWKDPTVYDLQDLVPPLHISYAERGSGATGTISTTGRSNQWQLESWQIKTIVPLDGISDSHVHLNFRIPVRRRQHPSISRSRDRP
jgi:hypothetical protein